MQLTKSKQPHTRSGWIKITLITLGLVVAVGSLVAFRVVSAKKGERDKPVANIVLEFSPADISIVENRELARTLAFSGSLSPVVQTTVKAKVPGEIRAVLVREGERVTQGQILAQIDTSDLQARLDAQSAALEETRARLSIAEKNRESNYKLLRQNFISQNAFDTTQSTLEANLASVKSAEAQLRLAQNALQDAFIRAPISGIVAKKLVNTGEKVGIDSTLFGIVNLAKMEIEALAPSSEIPGIKAGQLASFRVDGFGDRVFEGKVERINPMTESGSRSIALYLSVANRDGALKGGMFAKGVLVLDRISPAAVVPSTAVREERGQSYVFTIEDGKLAKHSVTLGLRETQAGLVEVKSGVVKGAQVVSARMEGLKPGASVVIKTPATPATPAKAA